MKLSRITIPKVAVIVRKAYGGGHIALGGRPVRPDLLVAWPTAEMGFMAPDTGVRPVYRRRLDEVLATEGEGARPTRPRSPDAARRRRRPEPPSRLRSARDHRRRH